MFSCNWKKLCCWKRLKTLAVSEACTTIDKNIFVSSKICFEWNLFFIVTLFKYEDWLFSSKQFFLQNIWLNRRCCRKCVSKCSKKMVFKCFRLYLKYEFLLRPTCNKIKLNWHQDVATCCSHIPSEILQNKKTHDVKNAFLAFPQEHPLTSPKFCIITVTTEPKLYIFTWARWGKMWA